MTRQQIISTALELTGQTVGSAGSLSPFLLSDWVNSGTDELARKTDAFFVSLTMDITAGTALYSSAFQGGGATSLIYKLLSVQWVRADLSYSRLTEVSLQYLQMRTPNWRNDALGSPRNYIQEGTGIARLYPVPDTTQTGALVMEGFAMPAGSWAANSATCPLPGGDRIHMAVAYWVAKMMCLRGTADQAQKIPFFDAEFKKIKADLEVTAATMSHANAHGDAQSSYPRFGGYY
jgi:hypothetical protein